MDERLRRREHDTAREVGNIEALVAHLKERQRRGENAAISADLTKYSKETRKNVYGLLDMSEDEQLVQEALILFGKQIDGALTFGVRPREGDAPMPDRETILSAIERTLTGEQAKVFLDKEEIHEPIFVLVPVTTSKRLEEELKAVSQFIEGPDNAYISNLAKEQLNAQAMLESDKSDSIKKWKFAITEDAQTFPTPDWDNDRETFADRISRFNNRYFSKNITRLDYASYAALMIQSLRCSGKPIDCEYEEYSQETAHTKRRQFTILKEPNNSKDVVGTGKWEDRARMVFLSNENTREASVFARFRPAVMGDIQA